MIDIQRRESILDICLIYLGAKGMLAVMRES